MIQICVFGATAEAQKVIKTHKKSTVTELQFSDSHCTFVCVFSAIAEAEKEVIKARLISTFREPVPQVNTDCIVVIIVSVLCSPLYIRL